MKIYYTGGTIGDTYVVLCKLYRVAKREKILVRHHTFWKLVEPTIREIYALLPNIIVEFLRDPPSEIQISGAFHYPGEEIERDKYNLKPEYYPEFELGSVKRFDLPEDYVTVQLVSGLREDRRLSRKKVDKIIKDSKYPAIIVGKNGSNTSVKEVVSIIRGSRYFYGPLGFLSFVAVSQKVPSTVYVASKGDDHAIRARIEAVEEWKEFLMEKMDG